jgi:hypothetical protein
VPFDQQLGASAARQLDLAREVGRGYVPVTGAPPQFTVLDAGRQPALLALVDTLIPGREPWPAASERGVAQYVDNSAAASGTLRQMLVALVDDLDARAQATAQTTFAEATPAQRVDVTRQVEAESAAEFATVLELTFEGYYRDRLVSHVVEDQTGFTVAAPLAGRPDEPFDESLVADVMAREKHYVEVVEVSA